MICIKSSSVEEEDTGPTPMEIKSSTIDNIFDSLIASIKPELTESEPESDTDNYLGKDEPLPSSDLKSPPFPQLDVFSMPEVNTFIH